MLAFVLLGFSGSFNKVLALTSFQLTSSLTPSPIVAPQTKLNYSTTFNNTSYGVITGIEYKITVYSPEFLPLTLILPPGVTCAVGTLNPGFVSYTYTCTSFSVPSRTRYALYATLNSFTSVPNSGSTLKIVSTAKAASTTASISVQNQLPDLKIIASSNSPAIVQLGQQIDYQVTVTNIGSGSATASSVLATFPDSHLEEVAIPALAPQASTSLTFSFTPFDIPLNGISSFTVDPSNSITEVSEINNTMSVFRQIVIGLPDLVVTQVDDPGTVASNSSFTRTITVTNIGDVTATPVSVRDTFNYMSVESVTGDHGLTCIPTFYPHSDGSSGTLCYGGSLAPGESATITEVIDTYFPISTEDGVSTNVTFNPYATSIAESDHTNNSLTHTVVVE